MEKISQAIDLFIEALKEYKQELEILTNKFPFFENLMDKKSEKTEKDIEDVYFDY